MKVQQVNTARLKGYVFMCPACAHTHMFGRDAAAGQATDAEGNLLSPSVGPRVNVGPGGDEIDRCNWQLNGTRITFLPDSTHALAGKTVELPDF